VSPEAAARLQIESQTDTTVNVIDPVTNQTVHTVPAKEIKYSITAPQGTVFALYSLVVLTENGNTGYSVEPYSGNPIESAEEMPAYFRQVFDSFELLAPPSTPITAATTPPPASTTPTVSAPQQQEQQPPSPPSQQPAL
jgi:hypothetical protein